ncbi:zinc finger CCCH domain-containing protein 18-like isoform X2 [Magnolia sinica]|uniref:zinc finger CCCH domain-containing protein 18-like isoform X2 n=1 Tax=Magnolia sinica TaxID=86752 RepID=UPI002658BE73|nr:zinc finger CCCH domain-containing protein 18-like isoform X2 [Magnolia sinica]
MDIYESTKVVLARIQSLESDHASKIIGYLLLQEHGDREMIRLAFGPDTAIRSLISRAKAELGLSPSSSSLLHPLHQHHQQQPFQFSDVPYQFSPYCPEAASRFLLPHCDSLYPPQQDPHSFFNQAVQQQDGPPPPLLQQQQQPQLIGLEDPYAVGSGGEYLGLRLTGRVSSPPSMVDVPARQCNYFAKGYCRHGTGCRFLHGARQPNGLPLSPTSEMVTSAAVDDEEHQISSSTLERLESELLELLRAKRTPVSIASLPQLYFDRFGRTLQADGYLTESQRHGKAGYSLTKLLARLKNTIRVIDSRPHGQHAVVPAEDAPRFTMYRSQHPNGTVSAAGSRQIYLTFPAESAFSEEDVSDYFKTYGLVQDVRIPCQQRRMFGFVTFVHAETVKMILAKGNPHYVCGARVLVKPYREKGKLGDRKYVEKMEPPLYSPQFIGHEDELHAEAHDQAVELERRRLFELQLLSKALNHQKFQNRCMNPHPSEDDTKLMKDLYCFPSAEHFGYLLEVLNSDTVQDEKIKNETNNFNDQESQAYNLPESPFASPISASSISMAS